MLGAAKARLYRRLATAVKAAAAAIIVVAGGYQAVFGSPWSAPAFGDLRALLSLTFDGGRQFRVSWGPAAPEGAALSNVSTPQPVAAGAPPAILASATAAPAAAPSPPDAAASANDAKGPPRPALALCSLADRAPGQGAEIVSRATLRGPFGGVIDGYGIRDPSLIPASDEPGADGYALPFLASIRSQGGLAGFTPEPGPAQAGVDRLPNTANAMSPGAGTFALGVAHDALDMLDVGRGSFVAELNPWYHSLNAGMRATIVGGLRCDATEGVEAAAPGPASLGAAASTPSVRRRFDERNLYVSDGHSALTAFTVNGKSPDRRSGAEVKLDRPGVVEISATLAAELPSGAAAAPSAGWDIQRARYGATRSVTVEIVVNGRVAASKPVPADGSLHTMTFAAPIERSSWVALRLMGAGHSNPVFVLVDNKPVRASRTSVEWSQRALLQAYDAESRQWSPADAPVAAAAFQYAYEIYGGILKETETP
ncbi:CehA/McbA family metallohydrolase [Hansschlegelia sp.]|uniref:CehA/McbA family metallohydrolase n=1 Tax=Hansschlegelia sp. TaxID=2041892 RepID=UPI002C9F310E|nr:CehA/McbA family metallohydrolase [Hansschlegelia sp.]HVI27933.1 CehA/McbA family metallohydrolase [Hansschlegelia sp.]